MVDQEKILVMTLIFGENFISNDSKHLDRHAVEGGATVTLQIARGSRKAHDDWIPLCRREDPLAQRLCHIRVNFEFAFSESWSIPTPAITYLADRRATSRLHLF
jgi:hypothetical protein